MVFVASVAVVVLLVGAGKPGFGELYYDGDVVRTVVPPAAMACSSVSLTARTNRP